jgi:SAM-dependent methyltransferase
MITEPMAVASFYATDRGAVAARLLGECLGALWPPPALRGQALLGYGYAAPYLPVWAGAVGHCVQLTPGQIGAARWPAGQPNLSCTGEEDCLPFADLSFDRILLVHGLEVADQARRLLRELWRVLKDDGRLLVVTPNRRGLWAHAEATPFGQGEPYSTGQIGRLLAQSLFRVERRDTALYLPPLMAPLMLRGAAVWERAGRLVFPQFAGLLVSEAAKDVYAALPVGAVQRRRIVLAEAA